VKRRNTQISVRGETYDKLRDAARKNGEQIGTLVDALIRRYLDEKAGKP
jgi:hypothetical protein